MYQLINQFFTKINLQSHLKSSPTTLSLYPYITIARDPGSGGRPIAKLVSRKLRYKFYDEALIEAIAKSTRKRSKIIKAVDEKTRNSFEDIVHNLFNPEYISDSTYINHLTNVVLAIAHQGKAVILGRGANFIAPPAEGLNVLITAPEPIRIKRAIEYEKISASTAKKRVEKITLERQEFITQYFNKDYSHPDYYDLIINTEFFDLESASEIIIKSFRGKFPTLVDSLKSTFTRNR